MGSRVPALAAAGAGLAGLVARRPLPAPTREWRPRTTRTEGEDVVLMADTFTRFLHPEVGDAAIRVLEATGARVTVIDPGCCGRPLLSQGLVGAARARVSGALDALAPHADAGRPIVVLEPSCWSMLTDDAVTLTLDPRAATVADACVTFESAVLARGLPSLRTIPQRVAAQPHCHARALGAGAATLDLLQAIPGIDAIDCGAGCCGMAGAFGYLHPGLSRAIAEQRLVPAVRSAALAVSAGTSCRRQMTELAGARAAHPAELLAARLQR
jgi:Fe-S oxidoreductase